MVDETGELIWQPLRPGQKVTEYGYYGDGCITGFVRILPVEALRFVVLAVIDEPWGGEIYGSTVAAPLVKEVMDALDYTQETSRYKRYVGNSDLSQWCLHSAY